MVQYGAIDHVPSYNLSRGVVLFFPNCTTCVVPPLTTTVCLQGSTHQGIISVFVFSQNLELNVDNVLDKLDEFSDVKIKWPVLAASLKQASVVGKIKTDVSEGFSVKLNMLITHWLENDSKASWKNLVIAMERSKQTVAAEKLAQDIGIPYPVK